MARRDVATSNSATVPASYRWTSTSATVVMPTLQRVIPDAPRIVPSNTVTVPASCLWTSTSATVVAAGIRGAPGMARWDVTRPNAVGPLAGE